MIDTKELRQLAQAVISWGCCNQAWLDQWEDPPAVMVGHINKDGETYPVATIDCGPYSAADKSLPLGKFYAAANPAAISELLDRLEAAEKERDALRLAARHEADCVDAAKAEIEALRAKIEAMERQEPSHWGCIVLQSDGRWKEEVSRVAPPEGYFSVRDAFPLYLAPGAKGE